MAHVGFGLWSFSDGPFDMGYMFLAFWKSIGKNFNACTSEHILIEDCPSFVCVIFEFTWSNFFV